ncbi:MAG: DNA methyltransferase [Epulopiscium sp. Nele67-Bin001]|nr:MAG: DNA methyltransferase [Epulopiscium sp. Nele67-Bin001]
MEKLKMETTNLTDKNIEKIAQLFPSCISEMVDKANSTEEHTAYKKGINFEILKQLLSEDVIEGDEAYEFTWVGKKAAMVEANTPIRKTLRPCKEESVNWDNTQNLYIEGDNLEVLKLLQENYLEKVKMIYIDPPYNTGNDFIYEDDFKQTKEEYEEDIDLHDEYSNRMFKNTDTNGRFHSDWCSMMYSRLSVAKNLLRDDGVIFISIDDNEQGNLKKLCDEIFGIQNFFAILTRRCMHTVRNSSKDFNKNSDFILVYATKKEWYSLNKENYIRAKIDKGDNYRLNDEDGRGYYKLDPIYARNYAKPYSYTFKNGIIWKAPQGSFPRYSIETLKYKENNNELDFNGSEPRAKRYLNEVQVGQPPDTFMREGDVGFNSDGTKELAILLEHDKVFSQPKPSKLISYLINLLPSRSDDIILDFFSGSATTAHAVMQLNAKDGGNRKFIMVQIPEECDPKSEAYKAGYKNICEIGKERIRRAAKKISEDNPNATFDGGFRVFKTDTTNMKDVYYTPSDYSQNFLDQLESNIKDDRTDIDLLFSCVLEWGLPLDLPYTCEQIDSYNIHIYNNGDLIACFDKDISESAIKQIAKRHPLRVVFRDSSFMDSPSKINVEELFKVLSPNTRIKVL